MLKKATTGMSISAVGNRLSSNAILARCVCQFFCALQFGRRVCQIGIKTFPLFIESPHVPQIAGRETLESWYFGGKLTADNLNSILAPETISGILGNEAANAIIKRKLLLVDSSKCLGLTLQDCRLNLLDGVVVLWVQFLFHKYHYQLSRKIRIFSGRSAVADNTLTIKQKSTLPVGKTRQDKSLFRSLSGAYLPPLTVVLTRPHPSPSCCTSPSCLHPRRREAASRLAFAAASPRSRLAPTAAPSPRGRAATASRQSLATGRPAFRRTCACCHRRVRPRR